MSEHLAYRCPFSWFQASSSSRASGPSSYCFPGPSHSDESVAFPTSDPSNLPVGDDFLRVDVSLDHDSLQDPVADSDLLLAAEGSSSPLPSGESPDPRVLDSQGFISVQIADCLCDNGLAHNSPGLQSTPDVDMMTPDLLTSDDHSVVNPHFDIPSDVDPPDDQSLVFSVFSIIDKFVMGRASVVSSCQKPAPMPPPLDLLNRRPTRPSLPVSGISSSMNLPCPLQVGMIDLRLKKWKLTLPGNGNRSRNGRMMALRRVNIYFMALSCFFFQ